MTKWGSLRKSSLKEGESMCTGQLVGEGSRLCCCCITQSCLTLCNPMDGSTPGFPVLHHLPEFAQTHVHWVRDAIRPSCPLLFPSPPAFNLSQHQGLFQWIGSLHQVAKILELLCQHQFFQRIFRVDFPQDWLKMGNVLLNSLTYWDWQVTELCLK